MSGANYVDALRLEAEALAHEYVIDVLKRAKEDKLRPGERETLNGIVLDHLLIPLECREASEGEPEERSCECWADGADGDKPDGLTLSISKDALAKLWRILDELRGVLDDE